MSDSREREKKFNEQTEAARKLEAARLEQLEKDTAALKASLQRIDELLKSLKPYYRQEKEVFKENSVEYKEEKVDAKDSLGEPLDLKKAKKELKKEYKKLKFTKPGIDLLKVEVSVEKPGEPESKSSALAILNQATAALADFDRLEEKRRKELGEKVLVFTETENKEQAKFKENLEDKVQSFGESLQKIDKLLTQGLGGGPLELSKYASKNEEDYVENSKKLQEEYEKCKFPPPGLDLVKVKIEVSTEESKELKSAISVLNQATKALANIEQLEEKRQLQAEEAERRAETAYRNQLKERPETKDDAELARYLQALENLSVEQHGRDPKAVAADIRVVDNWDAKISKMSLEERKQEWKDVTNVDVEEHKRKKLGR